MKKNLKPKCIFFFCQDTGLLISTFKKYLLVQAYYVWIKAYFRKCLTFINFSSKQVRVIPKNFYMCASVIRHKVTSW